MASWSGASPPPPLRSNDDHFKVSRRRARIPLSCGPCRVRKLKCDRSLPCEMCIKRGLQGNCIYATSDASEGATPKTPMPGTIDKMQDRIDKLERLVLSLAEDKSSGTSRGIRRATSLSTESDSQPWTPESLGDTQLEKSPGLDETDPIAKSFGYLEISDKQASYLGDAHWTTILHEIAEVKSYFTENGRQYEEMSDSIKAMKSRSDTQITGPAFFLGYNAPDIKELVNRLPGKPEVDKLVDRYFSDYDPGLYFLHMPSWRRKYERFWMSDTHDAAFLSQLYAICGLAMQSYTKDPEEPFEYRNRTESLSAMYRRLTQQCLQLVDYKKIEQTTIETLCLHIYAEYQKSGEAEIGVFILSRTLIGLAMRIGMHRDGTNFPGMSPFQSELRRRQWAYIRMVDVIWSFTSGLPIMIKDGDTDTRLPLNLRDEDFDEETLIMPPARPKSELTDISYLIVKTSIATVFGRITVAVSGSGMIRYEDVVLLNSELHDTYNSIFPDLLMRSDDPADQGSAGMFAMRLSLAIQYNKAVCVLHRKYLVASRTNISLRPSRQACVDAAMALLRYQQLAKDESILGGRIYRLQAHTSAYMTHDFILAATLVALDLVNSVEREASGFASDDVEIWGRDRKDEQLQALESARTIWDGLKDRSVEAYKAYSVCGVLIDKIKHTRAQKSAANISQETTIPGTEAVGMLPDNHLEHQTHGQGGPASLDGKLAPFMLGADLAVFPNGTETDSNAMMDWDAWDEYIQNAGLASNFGNEGLAEASETQPNLDFDMPRTRK